MASSMAKMSSAKGSTYIETMTERDLRCQCGRHRKAWHCGRYRKFGMGRLIDLELCTEEDLFDGVTVVLGKYSHHGIGAW